MIVSGVFFLECVVKDIVVVDCPLAIDPLMQSLVENWFPGQLVIDFAWAGKFEDSLLRLNRVFDVLVIRINDWASTKSPHRDRLHHLNSSLSFCNRFWALEVLVIDSTYLC